MTLYSAVTGLGGPLAALDEAVCTRAWELSIDHLSPFLNMSRMESQPGRRLVLSEGIDHALLARSTKALARDLKTLLWEDRAVRPAYLDVFSQALGHSDVEFARLATFRVRFNAPTGGALKRTEWHQDSGTWYNVDLVGASGSYGPSNPAAGSLTGEWRRVVYTLWVPLTDCNAVNGLEVIPGSHLCGLQDAEHTPDGPLGLPTQFQRSLLPLGMDSEHAVRFSPRAGEGIVFHSLLFHRTVPNTSDELRVSFDVRCTRAAFEDIGEVGIHDAIWRKRRALASPVARALGRLRGRW